MYHLFFVHHIVNDNTSPYVMNARTDVASLKIRMLTGANIKELIMSREA